MTAKLTPVDKRVRAIKARCTESNPEAVAFDKLDRAIIGYGRQHGMSDVLIYSGRKLVDELMRTNRWNYESAIEWFGNNTACSYVGPGTPIIMDDFEEEDV